MIEPELRQAIETAVEREGAHLIELIGRGDRTRQVLEVFVDAETGVTTETCAAISRGIVAAVESAGLLPGSYRLDVSSPGIDRPLRFPWQYRKHLGRSLRVIAGSGEEQRELVGTLTGVGEEGFVLDVGGEAGALSIRFTEISEARVPAPW
jgi:ribosome maturation factor RimP